MITIVTMLPRHVPAAKMVIASVAQRIFEPEKSPDEFAISLEQERELQDVDNFQQVYDGQRGTFFVVLDDERVVGTGALKPHDAEMAELKRIWLLEEYHRQGIGYRVVTRLLDFARQAGYRRVWLQTSLQQQRAIAFYKQIGFVDAPDYHKSPWEDDISLEINLQ